MMHRICPLLLALAFVGCAVGHGDFISVKNQSIGMKVVEAKPYSWPNSGQLVRSDFLIAGEGLTRISKNEEGDLLYHYSVSEVLPHFHKEEWVGKCLIYEVIDPSSKEIKAWGFDKGGNPQSCRTWP